MEKRTLRIRCEDGNLRNGYLKLIEQAPSNEDAVFVELEIDGRIFSASSERGYFHAFCDIRNNLEPLGFLPLCFAASEDVYPSPMIESMGSGEKAYRLTPGIQTTMDDLVHIFDTSDDIRPVSVTRQQIFYKKWIESL